MPLSEEEILKAVRPTWIVWLLMLVGVIFPGLKGLVFLFMSDLYLPEQYGTLQEDDPLLYYTLIDCVRDSANGYLFIVALLFIAITTPHLILLKTVTAVSVCYFIVLFGFMTVELIQWNFYDPAAFLIDTGNLVGWSFIQWKLTTVAHPLNGSPQETTSLAP